MENIKGWIKHSEAVASDKYPQYTQEYLDQIPTMDDPRIKSILPHPIPFPIILPSSYSLLSRVAPARENQQQLELCFAFAGCGIAEYFIKNTPPLGVVEELSELFLGYWSRYILNGNHPPTGDNGSTILATMQALQQFGICVESLWPYIAANEDTTPPASADAAAKNLDVGKYFAISQTQNQAKLTAIKRSLYAGIPLMFGCEVHRSINNVGSNGIEPYAPPNSTTDPVESGHARYIIGWDDTVAIPNAPIKGAFLVMNSWGPSWGADGTSWISYQTWLDQETDDMGITTITAVVTD